jgi:hypothetical protein
MSNKYKDKMLKWKDGLEFFDLHKEHEFSFNGDGGLVLAGMVLMNDGTAGPIFWVRPGSQASLKLTRIKFLSFHEAIVDFMEFTGEQLRDSSRTAYLHDEKDFDFAEPRFIGTMNLDGISLVSKPKKHDPNFPNTCSCGAPAYLGGGLDVDCSSSKCRHFNRGRGPRTP